MFWTFDPFWNSLSCWHQKVGGLRYLHRIVSCWQPGGAGMTNRARGGSKYTLPLNKFQTLLVVVMWGKLCWWYWLSVKASFQLTVIFITWLALTRLIFLGHQWHHGLKTVPFCLQKWTFQQNPRKFSWPNLDVSGCRSLKRFLASLFGARKGWMTGLRCGDPLLPWWI